LLRFVVAPLGTDTTLLDYLLNRSTYRIHLGHNSSFRAN